MNLAVPVHRPMPEALASEPGHSLDKARQRVEALSVATQRRVTFLEAEGERADEAVDGRRFAAVLCHGVLGYLEQPEPIIDQLCRCTAHGGIVSIMAGNAGAAAVQPALERRWDDALAAFDTTTSGPPP